MMKKYWTQKTATLLLLLLFSCNLLASSYRASHKSFATRKDVRQFIHEMHTKHGFDKSSLTDLFKNFSSEEKVLQAMTRQYEALPWYRYRSGLITEKRVQNGVDFWKKNSALLKKAQTQFGVPAEIIIAIIGIESSYGQRTGTFPVLQTLSTLAFDYPPRARFFREELEHFLLLTHEERLDPQQVRGSYAGAMGGGQFMPSSYRRYAVDFSGKGRKDLLEDTADIIGSVANYLKSHGWKRNEAIANLVFIPKSLQAARLKTKDLKPHITLKELSDHKIQFPNLKMPKDKMQKVKFIELENKSNTKEYWAGFYNFYVITRYNHSTHYAMAVYQLSQKIRAHYTRLHKS